MCTDPWIIEDFAKSRGIERIVRDISLPRVYQYITQKELLAMLQGTAAYFRQIAERAGARTVNPTYGIYSPPDHELYMRSKYSCLTKHSFLVAEVDVVFGAKDLTEQCRDRVREAIYTVSAMTGLYLIDGFYCQYKYGRVGETPGVYHVDIEPNVIKRRSR